MTLRTHLGDLRQRMLSSVQARVISLKQQIPIVSFSFDDFPRTAYTAGGRILRSYGLRSTYYVAPELIGTKNDLGDQMTAEDIDAVLAEGHEIGSHTFSHSSCRRLSTKMYERDVFRGRDVLRAVTGTDAGSFAYPYGHVPFLLKGRIGAQMSSCRSIYAGINGAATDLNLLRANSLYGDTDQLAKAESLLNANEKQCGWLIFYTHDVRLNPSPWGCTPELLERTTALAVEKGFRILPVGEVVETALSEGHLMQVTAA